MSKGLRESLEEAFDEATTEPVEPTDAPVAAAPADTAPGMGEAPEAAAAPEGRDEKGRFATKAKPEAVAVTPEGAAPTPEKAPAAAPAALPEGVPAPAEALKAPQSWRPAAREKWAALPAEAQQEVLRREQEVGRALSETAEERKVAKAFRDAVAPYEGMLRAEGMDGVRATGELLRTFAALRTSSPEGKAQVIAGIIKGHGVSVEHLAAALDGQAPQGQGAAVDTATIARQVREELTREMQGHASQRAQAESVRAVHAFATSGKAEFLEDVREDMADLIQSRKARGVDLSLEDAYSLACRMHPEVSKVLQQREAATHATANQAATQRARAAASSVRTRPAAAQATGKPSRREALEAAFEEVSGR